MKIIQTLIVKVKNNESGMPLLTPKFNKLHVCVDATGEWVYFLENNDGTIESVDYETYFKYINES